jgi:hypothetical protein
VFHVGHVDRAVYMKPFSTVILYVNIIIRCAYQGVNRFLSVFRNLSTVIQLSTGVVREVIHAYIHIYTYKFIYIYTYINICLYIYIYTHTNIHIFTHKNT